MTTTPARLSAAALAACTLVIGSGAQAHAYLVKSTPEANATVVAPATIRLEFSEALEAKFSRVDLVTAKGSKMPVKAKFAGEFVEASPGSTLAPGAYMLQWRAVSEDGHKTMGAFGFTVK